MLGPGIQRRSRLVQNEDSRLAQERAGDADALALAAGQLQPLLAYAGMQAVR
ncbi:hypothetical protein GCM10020370_53860 [Paenibacillus hodogayensis]